jgi:hypothetical protein
MKKYSERELGYKRSSRRALDGDLGFVAGETDARVYALFAVKRRVRDLVDERSCIKNQRDTTQKLAPDVGRHPRLLQ